MKHDAVMNRTRLIVVSMLVPMIAFTGFAYVMRQAGNGTDMPLLVMLGALAVIAGPSYWIVRRQMTASLRKRGAADDAMVLLGAFQTITIIGAALAEGVGMLAAVVLLVTGNVLAIAGTAVAIAGLLASIPTSASLDSFLIAATGRPREGRWA